MPNKVWVEGKSEAVVKMFREAGWEIAKSLIEAHLVQFTGGEDVSPMLYNHGFHRSTNINYFRDQRERIIFHRAYALQKPMAGICRGGQFLNVMCGGTLYQHVDNHNTGKGHEVIDEITGDVFDVTSTHHQMMRPHADAEVLAIATESSRREWVAQGQKYHVEIYEVPAKDNPGDVEICYYRAQNCLCFQPHPEYAVPKLAAKYFDYIETYLFTNK